MSRLLQPEDDFLSHPAPTAFNPDLTSLSSTPLLLRGGSKAMATSPPPHHPDHQERDVCSWRRSGREGCKESVRSQPESFGWLPMGTGRHPAEAQVCFWRGRRDGGGLRAALEAEEPAGIRGEEKRSRGGVEDEAIDALRALRGSFKKGAVATPTPTMGFFCQKVISREAASRIGHSRSRREPHRPWRFRRHRYHSLGKKTWKL